MELAWLFGSTRMESEEGLRYLEQAEARATSLALAPRVRFQLPYTRGAVLRRAHQPEESAAAFEQALSIATEREHPDDHEIARARMSLATAYIALGRLDEARAAYQEAIETWERVDGPDHPNLANPLLGLARIEMGGDHPERAVPYAERGAALSLDSRDGGSANLALADAYRVAGRPEEALGALDVSHALTAKTLGDDHPMLLAIHRARAGSYWSMGRFDEAEDAAERAIEFARQSQGERSAAHATALALRGFLRTERDPDDVARADLEHALALLADVEPDAVRGYLARAELGLARIEAASGNLDAVRTHVERVRELGGNSNRYRSLVALADFELARVLATGTAGRDPACTLAKAALESISTRPSAANKAEQMRAWVEERCRVIGIPG
jgi:tetratricopeptide (TPR) repeat protein